MRAARCAGTLMSLGLAMVPSVVTAQNTTSPNSGIDPAKLRLFLDAPAPSTTLWTGPPKNTGFWNPPPTGSEVPQWTVEWKALIKGSRSSAFSVGFIGQRGNPMPLYWSQGTASLGAASFSIAGPFMYRDQAGLTFGVRSPALTIKGAEVSAFADLYVPVSNYCPKDPVAPILNSPVIRAGIKTIF
jgi:hypothetical protein